MKKLIAFWFVLTKSLTSLSYYSEVIKTKTSFTLKYFVFLSVLAALVSTTYTVIPLQPKISGYLSTFSKGMVEVFPNDLIIKSDGTNWSINKPEPYFIPLPEELIKLNMDKDLDVKKLNNLVVFDKNGVLDDLEKYGTLILVNKTNVLVQEQGKISVTPISNMPQGEFNKASLAKFMEKTPKLFAFIPVMMAVLIFIGNIFYFIFLKLGYLFIVAGALLFIGFLRGGKLSFREYFKIAVHTYSLPLLVGLIVGALSINIPVPMWFFLTNLGFGVLAVISIEKQSRA